MFQLSEQIQRMSPSMTVEISNLAKKLKAEGKDVLSFSVGEPDFDTPTPINNAAKQAIDDKFTRYTAVDGIEPLKSTIASYLKKRHHADYENSEISVGVGAKHSLFNLFAALLNESDEVIVPAPYWVSYPELVTYFGGKPVFIDTTAEESFKLTAEKLKKNITPKTKILVLCTPSNPTGSVYSKAELKELAQVLKDTNIIVIADEIYDRLVFDDLQFTSAVSISEDMQKRTILVNGVSKFAAMTGWRMGFFACKDKTLVKTISGFQSNVTTNINSITQIACIKAFDGSIDADVEKMKQVFEKRRNLGCELFNQIKGLKVDRSQGAFYLFVDCSAVEPDSLLFCKKLLEQENVALVPGVAFGTDGYFRFSFATSDEIIEKGIARISRFVSTYK